MSKVFGFLVTVFISVSCAQVSAMAQAETLVSDWVKEDLEGVSAITDLLPFEKQNIEGVKARLSKDWHVEETNLGFGAKYLELGKGQGYSKGYLNALIYNGRVARYEAGIESYSDAWPKIKRRISEKWRSAGKSEATEEEHGLVVRQTLIAVLNEYQANVALALGAMRDSAVPQELQQSYETLTNPMENLTLSGTRRDEDIEAIKNANRLDLLENILRGYNPGARVLAALTLLESEKSGTHLSPGVRRSIGKVLALDVELHVCVIDMCNNATAREALQWFDSGLAFPRPRMRRTRHKN